MKFFDDSDQLRRLLALTIGLFCGINFYIYEFASNLLLASFFLITILNFKKILLSSIKFYFKALLLIILSYFVFFLKGAEYPIFIVLVISISVVTLSNYTKNISNWRKSRILSNIPKQNRRNITKNKKKYQDWNKRRRKTIRRTIQWSLEKNKWYMQWQRKKYIR